MLFVKCLLLILVEFSVFSFLGWIIDSSYRSILNKKFINAGYLHGPFCVIYGFGALVLIFFFKLLNDFSVYQLIIIGTLSLIVTEYIGGVFSLSFLKVRVWDYSKNKFNIHGHIDLLHSIFWVILSLLFYYFIFPYILIMENIFYNINLF